MRQYEAPQIFLLAILVWIGLAAPAASAPTTYEYVGTPFTVCGFGCPDHAPANWQSDYLIATISFAAPLAPNMPLTNVFPSLTRWTFRDALGYVSLSSAKGDVLTDVPGLGFPIGLSTDSHGNIVDYVMFSEVAYSPTDPGHSLFIVAPPVTSPTTPGGIIADLLAVNLHNDPIEWDVVTGIPGQWSKRLDFFTLAPCRLIDTRTTDAPALAGGASRTFVLAGKCSVSATAKAVSINVTVTQPTAAGDLRLFPGGTALPLVSAINYSPGQTRANSAVVALGAAGDLTVRCDQAAGSTTHLILDVNGYLE